MTIDLPNGHSVTIDSANGKTWLCVRARGAQIGVELDEAAAMRAAGEIIASVRRGNRKS